MKFSLTSRTHLSLVFCLACVLVGCAEFAPPATARTRPAVAVTPSRRRAIALVKQAEAAFYRGDYGQSLWLCRQAVALDAGYARAFTWQAASHEKRGELAAARAAYRRVLALSSGPDAVYAQGRLRAIESSAPSASAPTASAPTAGSLTASSLSIRVNGQPLGAPALVGASGRLLVPMRALFEAIGAQVSFDAATGAVLARRGARVLALRPGQGFAHLDGRRIALEEPARLQNGQLILPLRLVAESFGARLAPDAVLRLVDVRLEPDEMPQVSTPVASPPEPAQPDWTSPAPSLSQLPAPAVLPTAEPENSPPDEAVVPPVPVAPIETDPDNVEASDPNVAPAARLLIEGILRAPGVVRVSGVVYADAHLLKGDDADATFHLDRAWKYFAVQVAMPDTSPGPWSEFRVWFDDNPAKTPFPPVRIYKGREPLLLLIPVRDVARLSLGPGFPGQPLVLINPRFIRGSEGGN